MAGIRFNTDQSLFDAFPSATKHIKTTPSGALPIEFLSNLLKRNEFKEAISFCAYLLPRREAVVWGCLCLRTIEGGSVAWDAGAASLNAAEAWAESPAEDLRCAALDRWLEADRDDPRSWLALAAAWAGGKLATTNANTGPTPQYLTPVAVRVAILLGLHKLPAAEKTKYVHDCLANAVRLAETGL